ncbi:MAG: Hsp70 family protein [Pseudomonadota bacterium]
MRTETLAIDFGTSNSAAAVLVDDTVRRIPIEHGAETCPTAVFFPARGGAMQIGAAATDSLIGREEGRYMRALKSVLGQPLAHEQRFLGGRRRTIADVIADFLVEVRRRAEAATGLRFNRALSGRPVHFHTGSPERDTQAEADLTACYHAAGFEDVTFLAEPEAAAIANFGMGRQDGFGLIVDIGGGTSDFSAFRSAGTELTILANYGIRLGGTDFDYALAMAHAMPQLGLGGQLRRQMQGGLLAVPRAPYAELATWARIPFLYTAETREMVSEMARLAIDSRTMSRFVTVLEFELGHELAFAVERAKIAANAGGQAGRIEMGFIEPGLHETVTPEDLDTVLADHRIRMRDAAIETLTAGGIDRGDVGRVILVGGSSLMHIVSDEMRALCPSAEILYSEAFTAVVDGLALATRR